MPIMGFGDVLNCKLTPLVLRKFSNGAVSDAWKIDLTSITTQVQYCNGFGEPINRTRQRGSQRKTKKPTPREIVHKIK